MPYLLGIDLGTTSTAAAVRRWSDGSWTEPQVVALGLRVASLPSVLYLGPDGDVLVGEAAERREPAEPERVVRDFWRRIGDPAPIVVGGRDWTPQELAALLVRHVVDRVAELEGEPARRIAVIHPTAWPAPELLSLVRALSAHGLTATLLSSAWAAAARYATFESIPPWTAIAVYELGGGRFDASVVRYRGRYWSDVPQWEVLGRPQHVRFGGVDIDDAVLERVGVEVPQTAAGSPAADPAEAAALVRLRRECVAAKEALSADVEVTIPVLLPAAIRSVRLTRHDVEELIRAPLEETVQALRAAVASAGLAPAELTVVLLVGGTAGIPLVERLVAARLGLPVVLAADSKVGLAMAAAILAAADEQPPLLTETRTGATTGAPGPDPAPADDAQFTVYRPAGVQPRRWYPLLVFAHRADPFVDADTGDLVEPLELVRQQATRLLADQSARYSSVTADGELPLPRGAEVILQPWLDGGEVNPAQASFRWEEPTHRIEFRLRAAEGAEGRRIRGGLRVFLGVLLAGEVSFTIAVSALNAPEAADLERTPVRRFRRIFASYSRLDAGVVDAVARYAAVTGDRYLIDTKVLGPGERWGPKLAAFIEESDIFQLFWSSNAMYSPRVRREWEHALSLHRTGFIRPVYWEDPRPVDPARELPPPGIEELHWARLPADPAPTRPEPLPEPPPRPDSPHRPELPRWPDPARWPDPPRLPDPPPGQLGRLEAPRRPAAAQGPQASERPPEAGPYPDIVDVPSPAPPRRWPHPSAPPGPGGQRPGPRPGPVRAPMPVQVPAPTSKPAPAQGSGRKRRRTRAGVAAGGAAAVVVAAALAVPALTTPMASQEPPGEPTATYATQTSSAPTNSGQGPVAFSVPVPTLGTTIPVGPAPLFVAAAPDGRTAYVASADAGTVTVIDTAVDRPVASLPGPGGRPQFVLVSPDGGRLYVGVEDRATAGAAVGVLDLDTNTLVATIPLAARPAGAAASADGALLYVPEADGVLTVIDTATSRVIARIPVPPDPRGVEVAPGTDQLFVSSSGTGEVSAIDPASDRVSFSLPVPPGSSALAAHPRRPLLAAVTPGANSVTVLDVDARTTVGLVLVGARPVAIAWAPDGGHLYVANSGDNSVSVIDAGTLRVTATIPVGSEPGSVAVTPNGRTAYVVNRGDGTVTTIEIGR